MDMSVLDTAIEIKGQLDTLNLALDLLQGGASIMVGDEGHTKTGFFKPRDVGLDGQLEQIIIARIDFLEDKLKSL